MKGLSTQEIDEIGARIAEVPAGTGRATRQEFRATRRTVLRVCDDLARLIPSGRAGTLRMDGLMEILRCAYSTGHETVEISVRVLAQWLGIRAQTASLVLRDLCDANWLVRLNRGRVRRKKDGTVASHGTFYRLSDPTRGWWRDVRWVRPRPKATQEIRWIIMGLLVTFVRQRRDATNAALYARGGIRRARLLVFSLQQGHTYTSRADIGAVFGWSRETTARLIASLERHRLGEWRNGQFRSGPQSIVDVATQLGTVQRQSEQRRRFQHDRATAHRVLRARGPKPKLRMVPEESERSDVK